MARKTTAQQLKKVLSPEHYGYVREWKDKGKVLRAQIIKRVAHAEKNFPQINTVDLIEFVDFGQREIRFGYYTKDRNGKWLWGQYCPCYPKGDLKILLRKAKVAGIL